MEVTTQLITDQETVVVTATPTAMPHYVNVDGSMRVELVIIIIIIIKQ